MATEPHSVRDIVVAQLRKTQFHRFEFVNGMLRACLKHHLLPAEKACSDLVLQSVHLRHDCVHRNGRDPDGKPASKPTVQFLTDLSAHFTDIVTRPSLRIDGGKVAQSRGVQAFIEDPFNQYSNE